MARLHAWLHRLDAAIGDFLEALGFRTRLAWYVLSGKVPYAREALREWNPNREAPIAVSVYDWPSTRTLALILVPPPLEEKDLHKARRLHHQRAEQLLNAFFEGAANRLWATGVLREDIYWDDSRRCWLVGAAAEDADTYSLEHVYE